MIESRRSLAYLTMALDMLAEGVMLDSLV